MSDSLSLSENSSSSVKGDPFALADLDRLAGEILEVIKRENLRSPALEKLAAEMKAAAASVTEFFIAQV